MLGIRGKMVGLGPPSCGRRIESRHGLYQRRYQCLEPGLLQRATGIRPRSNLPPARRVGCGQHTWLPGMGSVALRRYRYLAHSQNWPAAGATEFRWTAVGRRFPIQLGPVTRKRRKCSLLRRRAGRARRFRRAIPKYLCQLPDDYGAADTPQLVHARLRPGRRHFSIAGDLTPLFRKADRVGWLDASGLRFLLRL